MFVRRSTYNADVAALTASNLAYKETAENSARKLSELYNEYRELQGEVTNLRTERTQYRQALHAIIKQETPGRNATVGRIVRFAQAALKGTFGKNTVALETAKEGVRD
jgi:uncharacterized protein YlxW (UPF0749 family)